MAKGIKANTTNTHAYTAFACVRVPRKSVQEIKNTNSMQFSAYLLLRDFSFAHLHKLPHTRTHTESFSHLFNSN